MANKKTENKEEIRKTTVRTGDAITVYNVLTKPVTSEKGCLNIMKLKKEEMFAILRILNVLKPIAKGFEEFVKDVQERLKPEGWDKVMEMRERFDSLTDDEKRMVNKTVIDFQKDVDDCVNTELDKMVEVEGYTRTTEEAFIKLMNSNDKLALDGGTILLLQQYLV